MQLRYRFIILAALISASIFVSCGKAAPAQESAESAASEETVSVTETPPETPSPSGNPEKGDPSYKESNPDIEEVPTIAPSEDEAFDPGFEPKTIIDENYDDATVEDPVIPESPDGEGAVAPEGTQVEMQEDTVRASLGEVMTVSGEDGNPLYTITVDSMELTDERNSYADPEEQIVKILYTVENTSSDEPVFAGPFRFRLTDENGLACRTYEQDTAVESRADIIPVEKGASAQFAIAYAIDGAPGGLTLLFEDAGAQYALEAPEDLLAALR